MEIGQAEFETREVFDSLFKIAVKALVDGSFGTYVSKEKCDLLRTLIKDIKALK